MQRRTAFPLNQLSSAGVFIALIAGGLYWLGGAWGVALLWGIGVLLILPLAVAPIGLFQSGSRLGSLFAGLAWLAAVGWLAYRAYSAIP